MQNQLLAIDGADVDLSTLRKVAAEAAFADIVQRTHETGDQLDVLRDERCDEVQGFLFSPAVPLKETHRLLAPVQSSMSSVARTLGVATAG
jgi:EAL domain-containing protein (putative c-di-GMP-specific phosphodiesterase class I)